VNLETFTGLTYKFPYTKGNIPFQHMISIFGYPNKMVLDFELCMTILPTGNAKHYKTTAGKMLPA